MNEMFVNNSESNSNETPKSDKTIRVYRKTPNSKGILLRFSIDINLLLR